MDREEEYERGFLSGKHYGEIEIIFRGHIYARGNDLAAQDAMNSVIEHSPPEELHTEDWRKGFIEGRNSVEDIR